MSIGRQAKIITPAMLVRVLQHIKSHDQPIRSRVIVLLSMKAGLRAAEIAGITWAMITDANGDVTDTISIEDRIAKKKSGRRIPVHPVLKAALIELRRGSRDDGPVILSQRGGHMRPGSVVNFFAVTYRTLQLDGCSSHSGRRTFVTQAARKSHQAGSSLRDVQLLAGHKSISTTERYIDGDSDAQRRLVALL